MTNPKTLLFLPGNGMLPGHSHHRWMAPYFNSEGYEFKKVKIDWKYRVMSDYIAQFSEAYAKWGNANTTVMGFSFGAMIALLSARDL